MFSQYSWWDFIKFCLALAVPYYAFVIIKYYRQDIREWISNRGQTPAPESASEEDDEEQESPKLYNVKSYNAPSVVTDPAATTSTPKNEPVVDTVPQQASSPQEESFDLPLPAEVIYAEEQSIEDILNNAQGLVVSENGTVTAGEGSTPETQKLANIVNQQKGNQVFGDISFNR